MGLSGMSEERDKNELPDAEIAERLDQALWRMATTAPQPRKAKPAAIARQKPRAEPKKRKSPK